MINDMPVWEVQFWFVATPRNNGEAPTLEKAVESRMFLDYEDADDFRIRCSKQVGGYKLCVFEATAIIPRSQV